MTKSKYEILYFGFSLIITFLCLIFTFVVWVSFESFNFMSFVKKNHSLSPVIDIYEADECPLELDLINIEYPGTINGCTDGTLSYAHECEISRKQDNGEDKLVLKIPHGESVSVVNRKKLNIWRGKKLCKKIHYTVVDDEDKNPPLNIQYLDSANRKKYSFYYRNAVSYDKKCPDNTNYCGILDTLNNKLCLSSDYTCPINKISFNITSSKTLDTDEYYLLNPDTNKTINISKENKNGKILVELEYNGIDKMCLNRDVFVNVKKRDILDLQYKSIEQENCGIFKYNKSKEFDDSYTHIDFITFSKLYEDNNIHRNITELPFYNVQSLKDRKMNLFYRNYIGWSLTCSYSPEVLDSNVTLEILLFSTLAVYFVLSIIMLYYKNKSIKSYIPFCVLLIIALAFISTLYAHSPGRDILDCLDENTKQELQNAQELEDRVTINKCLLTVVILISVLLLFTFLFIILLYRNRENLTFNEVEPAAKEEIEIRYTLN